MSTNKNRCELRNCNCLKLNDIFISINLQNIEAWIHIYPTLPPQAGYEKKKVHFKTENSRFKFKVLLLLDRLL